MVFLHSVALMYLASYKNRLEAVPAWHSASVAWEGNAFRYSRRLCIVKNLEPTSFEAESYAHTGLSECFKRLCIFAADLFDSLG
jgi:hypothetical protein